MGEDLERQTVATISDAEFERFWSKVQVAGPSDCWPWKEGHHPQGYGKFTLRSRTVLAHRIAALIGIGQPTGPKVLHRCDNPPCCNPAHLRYGTQAENIRDRDSRGHGPQGERHVKARLTEDDVRLFRVICEYGATPEDLAPFYGVQPAAIRKAIKRQTWRHVA